MLRSRPCLPFLVTRVDDWPALAELAERYGVSREYWDWRGQHVPVQVSTVQAVLGALDVDASTDESVRAALADLDEAPWRRLVPPVTVGRAGQFADVLAHHTHGDTVTVEVVTEAGAVRPVPQADHDAGPRPIGERTRGRDPVRGPRRRAGRLPHAPRPQRRPDRGGPPGPGAGPARPAAPAGGAGLGADDPALLRPLAGVVGHRRLRRPGRPRVVGGRPRSRVRARQPAARRRAGAAARGLAVPADLSPLPQPALRPGHRRPRAGVAVGRRPRSRRGAGRRAVRRGERPARPTVVVRRQAGGPRPAPCRAPVGRAGGPAAGVLPTRGPGAAAVRHLVRPLRAPRRPGVAGRAGRPGLACGRGRSPTSSPTGSTSSCGCSGSPTSSLPPHRRGPSRQG